jgi:hypothetical protein
VKRVLLLAVAAVFLVAGCGDDNNEATPTETATVTTPVESTRIRVYFLHAGKVWPVARRPKGGEALIKTLVRGPTADEAAIGLTTSVPSDFKPTNEQLDAKTLVSRLDTNVALTDEALAQIVYTWTEGDFGGGHAVIINGKRYTRADFEEQTPLILVESPLPFEEVKTPLRVTGTANTFEATFQYELVDSAGKVVDTNFVTATSGTGTRGTFDFTTNEVDDLAALHVFELSAENGSRVHEVEIPLRMSQ